MNDATRQENLARRALESGILDERAKRWERRYRGLCGADELASLGNEALTAIVREFDETRSGFDDYCRWQLDLAMLTGIRVEARQKRIERAAQLASADVLATYRSEPGASADERLREITRALSAATFVAAAEEARRGGEDDAVAREAYATAHAVIAAVLGALPQGQRRLFVLHYEEGKRLSEAKKILGIHQNTAERWRAQGLAAIRKELEKRGIRHTPERGGGPRFTVLAGLRAPADEARDDEAPEGDADGAGAER